MYPKRLSILSQVFHVYVRYMTMCHVRVFQDIIIHNKVFTAFLGKWEHVFLKIFHQTKPNVVEILKRVRDFLIPYIFYYILSEFWQKFICESHANNDLGTILTSFCLKLMHSPSLCIDPGIWTEGSSTGYHPSQPGTLLRQCYLSQNLQLPAGGLLSVLTYQYPNDSIGLWTFEQSHSPNIKKQWCRN